MTIITPNIIVGTLIIIINLIPLITKKYRLLLVTGAISVLLGIMLISGII